MKTHRSDIKNEIPECDVEEQKCVEMMIKLCNISILIKEHIFISFQVYGNIWIFSCDINNSDSDIYDNIWILPGEIDVLLAKISSAEPCVHVSENVVTILHIYEELAN